MNVPVLILLGSLAAAPHAHGVAVETRPALNHGAKWNTNPELREAMEHIRDLATAPKAKSSTPEQFQALAGDIEAAIASLMAHCELPPDADAELHKVLVEFWSGTGQMKKDGDRAAGLSKVVEGLRWYADAFDHPGFKPQG
jgi:hypothetical protein